MGMGMESGSAGELAGPECNVREKGRGRGFSIFVEKGRGIHFRCFGGSIHPFCMALYRTVGSTFALARASMVGVLCFSCSTS